MVNCMILFKGWVKYVFDDTFGVSFRESVSVKCLKVIIPVPGLY